MLIYTVVATLPVEKDGKVRKLAERIAKGYGEAITTTTTPTPPPATTSTNRGALWG